MIEGQLRLILLIYSMKYSTHTLKDILHAYLTIILPELAADL